MEYLFPILIWPEPELLIRKITKYTDKFQFEIDHFMVCRLYVPILFFISSSNTFLRSWTHLPTNESVFFHCTWGNFLSCKTLQVHPWLVWSQIASSNVGLMRRVCSFGWPLAQILFLLLFVPMIHRIRRKEVWLTPQCFLMTFLLR